MKLKDIEVLMFSYLFKSLDYREGIKGVLYMYGDGLSGRLYRICEVITKFAYVNILWFVFTLLSLIIFGFMPATVALFSVTRKWVMGDMDVPVFSTFWGTYR